ncbi:MAG: acyl carrier protein [Endomicrobia bacterium]|nr:acyl carrier protein [Endomicrobiia bacterium]
MLNKDINNELKKIIVKNSRLKTSVANISDNSDLINDFGYDSVSLIELIVNIEQTFNITFNYDMLSIDIISNFKNLCDCIKTTLKNS